jgi:phosphoglycerate dehydrogenase-like enzyme
LVVVKIAVLDDYWKFAQDVADWSALAGAQVDFFHDTLIDHGAVVTRLAPYDVLMTTRERTFLPRAVLERLPNLKLIAGTGGRQANVDMDAATELGIVLCITGGGPSRGNATAELAWALILGVTRHLAWEDRQMRAGKWQTRVAEGLGGKTLGILGMGRLGTRVSQFGNFFDMDVIAWGPTLDAKRAAANSVEYVQWDELFARSDVLSIHVPLTDMSRGWVTEREFGLMKHSAFLVNTSRGPIIREHALVDALKSKQIAGAALDVYDVEPLPANHPFLSLDNVLLAPHLGYSTGATLRNFFVESIKNVAAWINGAPINVLNKEVLAKRRS